MTNEAIAEAKELDALKAEAAIVEGALNACAETAMAFAKMMRTTPFVPLIGACDFLNCLGDAIVGWLHIKMANGCHSEVLRNRQPANRKKPSTVVKIEAAKFFINRITGLVPAKLENLKKR